MHQHETSVAETSFRQSGVFRRIGQRFGLDQWDFNNIAEIEMARFLNELLGTSVTVVLARKMQYEKKEKKFKQPFR